MDFTTSVTVISGSASMGAVKKPEMTLRAIHCPLVLAYGLDSNMSGELFLFLQDLELLTPT
jgi:hypothetical protein